MDKQKLSKLYLDLRIQCQEDKVDANILWKEDSNKLPTINIETSDDDGVLLGFIMFCQNDYVLKLIPFSSWEWDNDNERIEFYQVVNAILKLGYTLHVEQW